ncbi:MAG: hypothetical protein AAF389_10110 [Gemmatimonadota bacterium]
MSALSERLRSIDASLSVPLPRRTALLRELRYDLDALTEELIAQGVPSVEARRRATTALVPDAGTLESLESVHASRYRRATAALDVRRLRGLERGLLAAAMTVASVSGATMLASAGITRDPSPFLWPVIGAGLVLYAVCLIKAFELWIKGDHAKPRRGLWGVAFLSGAVVVLGAAGVLTDTIVLFGTLEASPDLAGTLFMAGVRREATLMAVAIVLALPGAVFWLVAHQWIALVEDAHRRALAFESH